MEVFSKRLKNGRRLLLIDKQWTVMLMLKCERVLGIGCTTKAKGDEDKSQSQSQSPSQSQNQNQNQSQSQNQSVRTKRRLSWRFERDSKDAQDVEHPKAYSLQSSRHSSLLTHRP